MGFRSLISLVLVLCPIAVTLGLLLGWDTVRSSQGLQPIFVDNSVNTHQYCQKSYGITPQSVGQVYTLNPNQWGWDGVSGPGACMNVTSNANDTYATPWTAPKFSVTWEYPPGPDTQPVHAFPNIALQNTDGTFPIRVDGIKGLDIDVRWNYFSGSKLKFKLDMAELTTVDMNANVAIDTFLDSDKSASTKTTGAQYEVMVWLGKFGPATLPIGWKRQTPATTRVINTTTFNLWYGDNGLQQRVLTWVASEPATKFTGDIAPLFQGLDEWGGPAATDYLGYMGLGSETLFSNSPVTFNVPKLAMHVKS